MIAATPDNLRAVRIDAGITQAQAAVLMEMTPIGVSQYETGRRPIDPARWHLLLIRVGVHPDFVARHPVAA